MDNKLSILDNKVVKMDNLLSKIDNKLIDQEVDENYLKCLLCDRLYKHLSGLCKHKKQKHPNYNDEVKKINYKQNNEINEKSEIEKLKELFISQIQKLEEKNKQLEILVKTAKPKKNTKNITNNINNTNNTNNSNNTNNTNNGTINNINIVQFGRESSELLTKEEISKILYERGVDGLLASIEVFPGHLIEMLG